MRFFIQGAEDHARERIEALRSLTRYEYYKASPRGEAEAKKAELFEHELDFAFFAAHLGWSPDDYGNSTAVERMFIRKELETLTVQRSNLLKDAVQVAVANALSKRKRKLWKKKAGEADMAIPEAEMAAVKKAMARKAPWTPWQKGGG